MRRRVAGLAIALVSLVSVPAAAAAPAPIEVDLVGLQRGSIVEGTVSFTASASSPAGVKALELFIGDHLVASVTPDGVRQKLEIPHEWITPLIEGSSELAPNGEYAVRATAVANGGSEATSTVKVIVDNEAAAPSGLQTAVTPSGVLLSWDANAEPDLLGYIVERGEGSSFVALAETSERSFLDGVRVGRYSYRVIAVRHSSARSGGRQSLPSQIATVTVAAASKPTQLSGPVDPAGGSIAGGAPAPALRAGESFGPTGLPPGVALPGATGLPAAPEPPTVWGSYEAELPFELPDGGIPLSAQRTEAVGSRWSPVPADGMRWIAAGMLLLAIAALFRLLALRLDVIAGPREIKLKL